MNELLCLSIQVILTPNQALIFKNISVKQFFFSPCNFSKNSKFKIQKFIHMDSNTFKLFFSADNNRDSDVHAQKQERSRESQ